MKKFLGFIVLLTGLHCTVQAAQKQQVPASAMIPIVFLYESLHHDLLRDIDSDPDDTPTFHNQCTLPPYERTIYLYQQREMYHSARLRNLQTLENIFKDLGIENITKKNPLPLQLRQARPRDFDLLLDMAQEGANKGQVHLPQHIACNMDHLKVLWGLADHYNPQAPQALYPMTLAFIKHLQALTAEDKNEKRTDANRAAFLQTMPSTHVFLLVQNFATLMADETYTPGEDILRPAVQTIVTTAYLRSFFTNDLALVLAKGIKQRAAKMYRYTTLYNRVNAYLYDNPDADRLFPLAPNFSTHRPEDGRFPISIQDLIDTQTIPDGVNNLPYYNLLDLDRQGLTSLEGLSMVHNVHTLTSLSLRKNYLTTLPIGIFKNLPRLKFLSLDENQLTSITKNMFNDLPGLETLSLNKNLIANIEPQSFAGLPKLTSLHVYNNPIVTFAAMSAKQIRQDHNLLPICFIQLAPYE